MQFKSIERESNGVESHPNNIKPRTNTQKSTMKALCPQNMKIE